MAGTGHIRTDNSRRRPGGTEALGKEDRLVEDHTRIAQAAQTQTQGEMMQHEFLDGSKHGNHDTVTLSPLIVARCATSDEKSANLGSFLDSARNGLE